MDCEKIEYGELFQQVSAVNCRDGSNNPANMSNGVEPFNSSVWASVVSSNQDGDFLGRILSVGYNHQSANHSFPRVSKNQKISCPSGDGFSDMIPAFDQNSVFQKMLSKNPGTNACQVSENGAYRSLPSTRGKRKATEEDQRRGSSMEAINDEEKFSGPTSQGKQTRENKSVGEKAKEKYVHMRAKRGQATSSHSLAERVRRERISERMKMLQDLVPGCNRITGKAVMLDEIINYVQSLQRQVEFLSMKLDTANSELNMDLDLARTLPNENLHPRDNDTAVPGLHRELSLPQTFQGTTFFTLNGFSGANPQFHGLEPSLWNHQLENIRRTTRRDSNQSVNILTPNGPL